MLVTNDAAIAEKAKHLSTQAKTVLDNRGFSHNEVGYNYRLPNILAAMGVAQLEKLPLYVEKKRANAQLYNEAMRNVPGVTPALVPEGVRSCYWLYSVVIGEEYGRTRDQLIKLLLSEKVETRPFFQPVHRMAPFISCRCGNMKGTEELALRGINLPSSVGIGEEDILRVAELIKKFRL